MYLSPDRRDYGKTPGIFITGESWLPPGMNTQGSHKGKNLKKTPGVVPIREM
jgi:hypothetical protein